MKKVVSLILTLILIMTVVFSFTGSSVSEKINPTLTLSNDNISYEISDNLYGVSFENSGYMLNGGLVSELVNNNSFECVDNHTAAWNLKDIGYAVATEEKMNDNNENYLHISVKGSGSAENIGYSEIFNNKSAQFSSRKIWTADMGFKEDKTYMFSAFFKNVDYVGTMSVLLNAKGNTEEYEFNIDNCTDWTKVSLEISSAVTADGSLLIKFNGNGTFYMDSVSLVPKSSNSNGKYVSLRTDLYDALKELSPSFIKFSENTYVDDEGNIYGWKDSIGELETRKQISTTYSENARFYVNPNTMGFFEYLVLCENIGATPVPVLSIKDTEKTEENDVQRLLDEETTTDVDEENATEDPEIQVPEIPEYVQNILDFIEYATGDETTIWGVKRVEHGHAKPFHLKYIALDDEVIDDGYWTRFKTVYEAVSEKYPQIKIITNTGDTQEAINATYKNVVVNEFYGKGKIDLYRNVHKYDDYERSGAQIAVDSFVSNADGIGTFITTNNIWSALENSAFLLGLEKNADVVQMASYKWPLAKRNGHSEKTSLIWFDSQELLLTADYYSQMIFANNMGTNYISTDFNMENEGIYQSSTVDTHNKVVYVKLVNTTSKPYKFDIQLDGFKNVKNPSVQYMTEKFKSAYNDFDEQLHVAPTEMALEVKDNTISYDMGSYSISVVRIPYGQNDGSNLYELPETDIVAPYMHPMVEYAVPIVLTVLVAITGIVILLVRINRHKTVRKENE